MNEKWFDTFYDEEAKEWSGRSSPLMYHPNVSIGQVILNALDKYPNRVVQVNDNNGIEMTSDQLKIRIIRAALHLSKFNLTNDDCIGIVARNNHHLMPIVTAALLIGVPINALDSSFDNADIQHMFSLTKPKIIFCDYDVYDHVKSATEKIDLNPKFITFDQKIVEANFVEDYFEAIEGDNCFVPPQIYNGENSIALIVCSSGTTGLSKAVCLSHAQVTHQFTSICIQTSADVYLCFSSIYWITGIISMLNGSITCCKRIITTEIFNPELFFKIVQKYKVTQVVAPPSNLGLALQYSNVAEYDLSSLRQLICGGGIVPAQYVIQAQDVFKNSKVQNGYGISELGGLVVFNTSDDVRAVGYIGTNLKIKIIDDAGNFLGVDEDGEIIIKPVYFFLGYKNDPELTKEVTSTGGWIYTGDIGHFNKQRLLFITDRKKNILKYRNFTISPSEIEAFLLQHRFIQSICVVGIRDLLSGDLPAAVIVKTPGCIESDNEIKKIVFNAVRDNLADYKILRGGVYIVEGLPMTLSGKVRKNKVQEIATELYNVANSN